MRKNKNLVMRLDDFYNEILTLLEDDIKKDRSKVVRAALIDYAVKNLGEDEVLQVKKKYLSADILWKELT